MRELELKERSSRSLLANVLDIDDDFRGTHNSTHFLRPAVSAATVDDSTTIHHSCLQTQRDLQAILKELRFITTKIRDEESDKEIISDWKFAAMVVDRFCLIFFTMFTIVATAAVLITAPHVF